MLDSILADFGAHKYMAALLSTLLLLASLAASGKVDPFLARFDAWQKTIVLAVLFDAGVFAQAAESGLAIPVAIGRAIPPLLLLLAMHYYGKPADPVATAQKAADVAQAKQVADAKAVVDDARAKAPPLPLLCLAFVAGCSGCGGTLTGPQVTPEVDAGCALVGIVVKDQVVGSACESAAPLIASLVADAINALGSQPPGEVAPTHLLPVTRGGQTIGYVRADLAPTVQAKLDAGAS